MSESLSRECAWRFGDESGELLEPPERAPFPSSGASRLRFLDAFLDSSDGDADSVPFAAAAEEVGRRTGAFSTMFFFFSGDCINVSASLSPSSPCGSAIADAVASATFPDTSSVLTLGIWGSLSALFEALDAFGLVVAS